jgi:TolB protein
VKVSSSPLQVSRFRFARAHGSVPRETGSQLKLVTSNWELLKVVACWVVLFVCFAKASAAEPTRLTKDGSFKQHLQWSPDGQRFLLTRIHEGKMAVWTLTREGKTLSRLLPAHAMPHFDASWSADGKRVVYVYDTLQGTDGKLQINTRSADGSEDKVFIPHKAFEESPRLSPDGKQLLWVSTRDGNPDLYTVDGEGKNPQRLTKDLGNDFQPEWSPDGKQIAFASGRSGKQKLFVMKPDGSDVKAITDGPALDAWPKWSPDGKRIAFVSNRTGNYCIWLMTSDGKELQNLTPDEFQNSSPAWSPDGKRLAFVSTRDGGSDVYVIDVK